MAGGTVTPFNLVQSVQDSIVPSGSNPANVPRRFENVPLNMLRLAGTGAAIVAGSGDVRYNVVNTFYHVVQWITAANASDVAMFHIVAPMDYHEGADELYVRLLVRKTDSIDENADLGITVEGTKITPGVAGFGIIGNQGVELPASGAAIQDFRWVEFLLSGHDIKAGRTAITLNIAPDDTVGSSNMTLDLAAIQWGYRSNIAEYRRHQDRFRTMENGVLDAD